MLSHPTLEKVPAVGDRYRVQWSITAPSFDDRRRSRGGEHPSLSPRHQSHDRFARHRQQLLREDPGIDRRQPAQPAAHGPSSTAVAACHRLLRARRVSQQRGYRMLDHAELVAPTGKHRRRRERRPDATGSAVDPSRAKPW